MHTGLRRTAGRSLIALLALAAGCADERTITPAVADASSPALLRTPGLVTIAAAPVVQSVTLAPSTVVAGATSTGTVTLSAASPAGGTEVGVSSNNTAVATVSPSLVIVPAGATSATFTVTSRPVASTDFAAISATANQGTQTAVLTVTPGGVAAASLALAPTFVASGGTVTGTVTLSGAAPSGGASVALASGNTSRATVPASVLVPAGQTSATFPVTAGTVASAVSVSIQATYGGVTQFASLIVTEPAPTGNQITALTISPDLVVGGVPTTGTVTIGSAVATATTVALSSTDVTVATVPASVTVPAGQTSATFAITTLPVTATGFTVIIGRSGGTERSASLTTTTPPTGPFISAIAFFPPSVGGGGPATGEISFNGVATQGGQVNITSSRPDVVQVPATGVVVANTSLLAFPVTTRAVSANTTVTITVTTCCGVQGTRSATFTVTTAPPPAPDVVQIQSAVFKPGGRGGTLTVKATSTSAHAILTVFRDASTEPYFLLINKGNGRYEGSFSFSGTAPNTVTVRSNLGGSRTTNVKR